LKTLVIKTALLLFPFVAILGFVEYRLRHIPNSYSGTKAALEKKLDEIEILVVGPSHAVNGITPQLLDRPAFNLANGSQTLHYDTEFVMKYADSMPNLKLVIFTISYHSLESRLINSIERWRAGFYKQVYRIPGEGGDEGFELSNYSYIALYSPKIAFRRVLGDFLADGSVNSADASTHGEVSKAFARQRVQLHEMQMRQADLQTNLAALERAISLLKRKDVATVFITIPTHRTYFTQINMVSYQRMQATIKQTSDKYQIQYFNYLYDERFGDGDFVDSDHLNKKGAEKFTQIINEDIVKKYVRR
jgi:hypothetical protein